MTTVINRGTVTFSANDGRELVGQWFSPDNSPADPSSFTKSRGVVVIAPAMATPASYYRAFAEWLAEIGYTAFTFDYRGIGRSSKGHMRHETADLTRWIHDARDALAYVSARETGPLTWLGHSLGSQYVPLLPHEQIDRVISVTAGNGYYKLSSPRIRWTSPLLWKVIAPLAIRTLGYYPGSRLNILHDVPAGVMREWSRWCNRPDYIIGSDPIIRSQFESVTAPIAAFSFTDDELLSAANVSVLHSWFTGASVTTLRFTPAQLGVERMGHFGFFRPTSRELWDELVTPYLATT